MIQRAFCVFLLIFVGTGSERISADSRHLVGTYYWRTTPVSANAKNPATAQLLTLFCSGCGIGSLSGQDVPLVSVLRDTLGDDDPANDKLTAIWLLSYSHPTLGQKAEAAAPFFYWHLGQGSREVGKKDTTPLLDLSAPEHPSASNVGRQLLQWTALDTVDMPLRATSREYRTNQMDNERLRLEETTTYLLQAPTSGQEGLTNEERNAVIARLELRKKLLGGFVASDKVAAIGREGIHQQEEIRSKNWELLRQCAEKTGLFFEPLNIGQSGGDESRDQYAMLWFPANAGDEPSGNDVRLVWKMLNLRDPYSDPRIKQWSGLTERRENVTLIPLGIYSLNYSHVPLLMIDFRDNQKLRRHELLQQAINELTAGIIGVSHFANWYYFVGADFYNFYQGRHGDATKRTERLDCYSQFRTALSLDTQLDAGLRDEMKHHVDAVSINPLASSEERDLRAAVQRYTWLQVQASGDDHRLLKRLDNERREELAAFGETPRRRLTDDTLHVLTLGRYNHRVKQDDEDLALLDIYRRVHYQLAYLDRMVQAGTAPEVTYQEADIRRAVSNLSDLMPAVKAAGVRTHVQATLSHLAKLSNDKALQAECDHAAASIGNGDDVRGTTLPGIVATPAIVLEDLK